MKPLKALLLSLLFVAALSVTAQKVTFNPQKPESGKLVSFTYDPAGSTLANENAIECEATSFVNLKSNIEIIDLTKEGNVFKGKVVAVVGAELINLTFSSGEAKDENPEGYYVLMHKKGIPKANGYIMVANFFSGRYLPNIKADKVKQLAAYEKAFQLNPALRDQYAYEYLITELSSDKVKGTALINAQIKRFNQKTKITESAMVSLFNIYNIIGNKKSADSVKTAVLKQYPTSDFAFAMAFNAFYLEKDPKILEQKVPGIIQAFNLNPGKNEDQRKISELYLTLANRFGAEKNYEKMEYYADKVTDKARIASLYNEIAWPLAEKNEETAVAAALSKKSIDEVKGLKGQEGSYAMYADTYALLLHNLGNDKEAVVYQEIAKPYSDEGSNERYVMYLDLSGNKEKAYTEAEQFLKEGKGTEAMRDRFKTLYEARKSDVPFNTFLANVDKSALEKQKQEWVKKMINQPAPLFSLVNMKGETVSLAALKGKVVVLDYWATWCGPCVASFPGMQKTVKKYADNPNVVFLFINTWQREANREKAVQDFFAANKYDFNVLYDIRNKENPELFDVITAYKVNGIPTKFVIDPKGNIRFMAVGFSGSADGIVKEMDIMISLAASAENKEDTK